MSIEFIDYGFISAVNLTDHHNRDNEALLLVGDTRNREELAQLIFDDLMYYVHRDEFKNLTLDDIKAAIKENHLKSIVYEVEDEEENYYLSRYIAIVIHND